MKTKITFFATAYFLLLASCTPTRRIQYYSPMKEEDGIPTAFLYDVKESKRLYDSAVYQVWPERQSHVIYQIRKRK